PAVFRPQTLEFLPELHGTTRPSSHAGLEFYYLDKGPLQNSCAQAISPVCNVFLDRARGETRLRDLTRDETLLKLRDHLLFHEDQMFNRQIVEALKALAEKPAYILQYGADPKEASEFIVNMLR